MGNRCKALFLVAVMVVLGILLMPNVLGIGMTYEMLHFNNLQDHFSEGVYNGVMECCAQQLTKGITVNDFYKSVGSNTFYSNYCINSESIECKSYKAAYCCKDVSFMDNEVEAHILCKTCTFPYWEVLREEEDRENTFYAILFLIVIPAIILLSLITLLILKHKSVKNKKKFNKWIILAIIIGVAYLIYLSKGFLRGF